MSEIDGRGVASSINWRRAGRAIDREGDANQLGETSFDPCGRNLALGGVDAGGG
jgi:hypothetical protein